MSVVAAPYLCPAGFDCAVANSCPAFVIDCPPGFFCSSYEGFKDENEIDYQYALLKSTYLPSSVVVTVNNADKYAEVGRYVSVNCLNGFHCPDESSIEGCKTGEWCPNTAIDAIECDELSACSANSSFQVNFVIPIIAAILSIVMVTISCCFTRLQRAAEIRTRNEPRTTGKLEASDDSNLITEDVFEIVFEHLSVCTRSNAAVLINDISGKISSRSVYAIMGPTGCGKSSLINTLRGETSDLKVYGKVEIQHCISGNILTAADLNKYVGYVPQQDILDRSLTVRELLTMHAVLRSDIDTSEAAAKIDLVLNDLQIRHIGDTIIGGSETTPANISGGQLKRVNIACELVSLQRPAVLFLDEPTAGLDANIAKELILVLKKLSASGVLVVLAVQQPRPEIFELFSGVMLMLDGGNVAFDGAPSCALPYFSSMGYVPTDDEADADFCIDVFNDIVAPASDDAVCTCAADLDIHWRRKSLNNGIAPLQISGEVELGVSTVQRNKSLDIGLIKKCFPNRS